MPCPQGLKGRMGKQLEPVYRAMLRMLRGQPEGRTYKRDHVAKIVMPFLTPEELRRCVFLYFLKIVLHFWAPVVELLPPRICDFGVRLLHLFGLVLELLPPSICDFCVIILHFLAPVLELLPP